MRAAVRILAPLILLLMLLLDSCIRGNSTTYLGSATPAPHDAPAPHRSPSPSPSTTPSSSLLGEQNFARLLRMGQQVPGIGTQAHTNRTPWAGYWWPDADGGISEAARLYESASGKTGAVAWEAENHGPDTPGVLDWWGHCNGWAAAAALFPEPRAARTVNGIRFGIGDQKALLSEVAMEVDADFYGERDDSDDPGKLSFQDIFPDEFFLVLTNYVGRGDVVLMDRYTGSQVWNQAIAGYRISPIKPSDVLRPDPSAPGITRVDMTTQVWWARDDVQPDDLTEPFDFQDNDSFQSRVLTYELWLDGPVRFDSRGNVVKSGNVVTALNGKAVIGGRWIDEGLDPMNSHPDYLWVAHRLSPSTGFANPDIDAKWVFQKFIAIPPAMIGRHL